MELTQQDYDTRKARVDKGEGDDEDARLVKHYEANGFTAGEANKAKPEPAGPGTDEPGERAGDAGHTGTASGETLTNGDADDKTAARRPNRK